MLPISLGDRRPSARGAERLPPVPVPRPRARLTTCVTALLRLPVFTVSPHAIHEEQLPGVAKAGLRHGGTLKLALSRRGMKNEEQQGQVKTALQNGCHQAVIRPQSRRITEGPTGPAGPQLTAHRQPHSWAVVGEKLPILLFRPVGRRALRATTPGDPVRDMFASPGVSAEGDLPLHSPARLAAFQN